MKNKKGFTLVELLAVIVILAIVALVVVPVVMGVIKDARKKSAIESFRGYMDAVEKTIIRDSMKATSELPNPDTNGCYIINEINPSIKMKGNKPEADDADDIICMTKGRITSVSEVLVGKYKLEYKDGDILINGKSAEGNVQTIEITNEETELKIGDKLQLTVSVTPNDANKTFTYTSSDTTKATVSDSGEVTGVAVGNVTITVTAKNGKKATKTLTIKQGILYEEVKLGDIIKMTPTKASYTIASDLTGCTSTLYCTTGTSQTINPSQMKWWRVISKDSTNKTIDVVSEYVATDTSGNNITFYGEAGYQKFIYGLNTIASQYANSNYTRSTRYFGYNGQTGTITDSLISNLGTTSTSTLELYAEYGAGHQGDTLYTKDYNALIASRKTKDSSLTTAQTLIGYKLDTSGNPTTTATNYWLASRDFMYNVGNYYWLGRYIQTNGNLLHNILYTSSGGWHDSSSSASLRPVLTLKPNLPAVTSSESNVDYVLE